MANVLLIDTNFSSTPIYQFLTQEGHKVTVVGNNPKDTLAKYVDDYIHLDYTDLNKIKKLIKAHKIKYIVPGCNDASYSICAHINENQSFPGIDSLDSTESIHNKKKFRSLAANLDLPIPKMLDEREIGSRWPVIVKPVDAYSGRGISILKEANVSKLYEAQAYARKVSRSQVCIVEDYIEGQLYSHTAFIKDTRVIIDCIVEEHCTINPFTVDTSRVCYDFPAHQLTSIRKDIHLLANRLKLKDGLIHTQFICNGDQYWLIEITRRCPGDLYSQLIEFSTGLNYVENYTRPFIGKELVFNNLKNTKRIMRHTIASAIQCSFGSIEFNVPIKIKKFVPTSLTGEQLNASPFSRVAVLFAEEDTEQNLNTIFDITLQRKLYNIFP